MNRFSSLFVLVAASVASTAFAECKDLVLRMQDPNGGGKGRELTMFLNCHGGSYEFPEATTISVFEWKNGQLCHAHRVCGNVKYWRGHFGIGAAWSWGNSVSNFAGSTSFVNDFVRLAEGARGGDGGSANNNTAINTGSVCINNNGMDARNIGPTTNVTNNGNVRCYPSQLFNAVGWGEFCSRNNLTGITGPITGGSGGTPGAGMCVPDTSSPNPGTYVACNNLSHSYTACMATQNAEGNARRCRWEGPIPGTSPGFPGGGVTIGDVNAAACRNLANDININSNNRGHICINGAGAAVYADLDNRARQLNLQGINACDSNVNRDINIRGGDGGDGYSPVFGIGSGESNHNSNVSTDWDTTTLQVNFSLDFGQIERFCGPKREEVCF